MKYIKEYKQIQKRITDLEKKIKTLQNQLNRPRLEQKILSNGILLRLQEKLITLEKRRYELECSSTTIRVLAFLHLI